MKNYKEINRTPSGVKKNDWNFKSIEQRKARWLLTLIAILTFGVGQMWGKVVYYNNAGNSTTPKIHFWGGTYPTTTWKSNPEMNQVGTSDIYWYEIGNNNKCIFRYNNGSDQQTDDLNVPSDYKNYYTDSDWDWYWPMTDLAPILNGTKIMVYGGVLNDWKQSNYYFMNTNSTSDVAATATKLTLSKNINSTGDSWYGATSIAGGEYYQGHWNSGFKCTVEAGYAYIVRGTTSDSHFSAQCDASGGNNLYKVLKAGSTDPTTTLTTTIGASTIGVGTSTLSVSTSGSAGKSVMDIDNVMYYYLYNGNTSTWSKVTLSTGNLDISALTTGHYKLATLLSDGNICVRADLDEFDIVSALTVTYNSNSATGGTVPTDDNTYSDGQSVTVKANSGGLYRNGYDFNGWNTDPDGEGTHYAATGSATFTIHATTILYAEWSIKSYDISYSPSSDPVGFYYTTAPSSANYNSTVNLTISRWAGYTTSVSVKDEDGSTVTVTNATSRTPSFTMPAKKVTVTVTATKINKPIVYVLKTQVTAGSNIDNFSAVESSSLFWGWGKGGTTNFYSSDAVYGTNVALSDSRAGSYIDEHGNTWYEFVSNQSSFNFETEYGVILRISGGTDTRLYESNANGHWVDKTQYDGTDNHSYFKGMTWLVPNGYTSHSAQLYTSNPDGVNRASIKSLDLSLTRVPPLATVTATPNMYNKGAVNKAYCWKLYSDAGCTSEVETSFSSLGEGKVQFSAPQTRGTYYLKLTVHSSADCNAAIDDEEVVSFTVTTDDMVFFKNVPGWGNVHVYFLGTSDYWDENLGSGCAGRDNGIAHGMTRIGNSDVYYYDYYGNSNVVFDGAGKAYIAFTDNYKPNSNNFSECQAVFRGDFSECAAMYVPENWITHYLNNAAYYNRGYWTTYMSTSSGFSFYLWDKTANSAPGEIEIISGAELTGTIGNNTYVYEYDFGNENNHKSSLPYTYGFKIKGCGGSWYGAADDMTITKCTDWNLGTDTRKCGISVNAALPHKFIFTLAGDGHVQVSVEYPVNIGDYRLLYDDDTQNPHPSQFIRKRANGKDTVAMYVRPSATENLKVQYCTGIDGETITWADYAWNSGSAAIDVDGLENGVYVFYLEQDGSGSISVNTSETKPYTGLYYIRTSCVDGGWNSYKTSSDNLMTYAQYPEEKGYGFNYYKAKWVGSTGTDVTYTIACDYSPSLCDTLTADPGNNPLSASEARSLPHSANIRFGWHSKTNQLKREYINGSTNVADRFLVMIGDEKMKDKDGNALAISGLNANEISFSDLNNWIYRCDVKAKEGAAVKLTANYDGHVQYFIGGADKTEEIIGGTGSKEYVMRVTYDFKTNRLMTAWLPSGTAIDESITLKADMMLIREGQNAATQVYFGESNKDKTISEIKTIFGVLEFQYDHIAGKFPNWSAANAYKYLMYYISFPFDVKVSEIFGAGVRGENWIIQKYNGAKRAQIGWFAETSTFWETLPGDSTLHANEGYLLLLDRISFNDPSSSIWYKQSSGNSVYLYFPSISHSIGTIKDNDETATVKIPSHVCNINRTFEVNGVSVNHKNTDSHWNVFGPPVFQSKTASTVGEEADDGEGNPGLKYFYSWNYSNNTLRTKVALSGDTVFKSMHGYMVQYAGDVTFTGAHIAPPAPVAARRLPSDKKYLIELQLMNESEEVNATYVELRENACDTFVLNEDMYMMRTSNTVDLYSFAGGYDVAANVLSVNNHVVPIGLDVQKAGSYRFTMPSAFSGTVTLVDNYTGAQQNLALGDYILDLEKGTHNNRISLIINIENTTTDIEGAGTIKDGKAHKFLQDGVMYILQNGQVYDAQGHRVE